MRNKFLIAFIFLSTTLFGQNKDTRELFKKFVSVCNAYKQLPLQLTIEYKKSSNIPLNKDDSSTMHGEFYIHAGGAYIRFGNAEQIITDSFALMVLKDINQMVLSESNVDITAQITNMINMPVNGSSIEGLADKYNIQQKPLDNETAILEITNKQNVYDTELPFEAIKLTYNTRNDNPVEVETVKRGLVKKTAESGAQFSAKVVSIPQKGEYLIKEDHTVFVYKTILHDANKKLPVTLADRIEKDASGNYLPVKAYKDYKLIVN